MARVVNITSSFTLNTKLDLKFIANNAYNVIHSSKPFEVTRMRFRKPAGTAMIYKTGKVVIVGCKSIEDGRRLANKLGRLLQRIGIPNQVSKIKVHNIVAAADLKKRIQIEGDTTTNSSFEPELFPGRCTKFSKNVKAVIFRNGKVHFTGAKTIDQIDTAYIELLMSLNE